MIIMSWTTMECKKCGYEEDIVISYSHEYESRVSELTMICEVCDPESNYNFRKSQELEAMMKDDTDFMSREQLVKLVKCLRKVIEDK